MSRTILVRETDENILEVVTFILAEQGFTVKALKSEQGAIQTILDTKPCLVILDVVRVTYEGTRLCQLIRKTKGTMHIPLIVLSTQEKAKTLKGDYADQVLLKPFDINEFIGIVQNASAKLRFVSNIMLEYGRS
jgi:DNA-binding response OmpR family regulator